jgi:hypothetical protein
VCQFIAPSRLAAEMSLEGVRDFRRRGVRAYSEANKVDGIFKDENGAIHTLRHEITGQDQRKKNKAAQVETVCLIRVPSPRMLDHFAIA